MSGNGAAIPPDPPALPEPVDIESIVDALLPLARLPAGREGMTVVVDGSDSMVVWGELTAELVGRLQTEAGLGRVVDLVLDVDRPDRVRLRAPGADAAAARDAGPAPAGPAPVDAWPTVDGVGKAGRPVLVLTDGAAPAWHSGEAVQLVRRLAMRHPVVILQMLPQHLWYRTGVRPRRLRLRPARPGAANHELTWQIREALPSAGLADWERGVPEQPVPVPVLELRSRWLAAWTRLVSGDSRDGWTRLPAILAGSRTERQAHRSMTTIPPPPDEDDARHRVRRFTAWASPSAVTLATYLAAAPLNLPVMRTLQQRLLPASDLSALSEVLNSGLLHPVAVEVGRGEREQVTFEFDQGVREELLAAGRRADTTRVLRAVDDLLGQTVPAVRGLRQVLDDPDDGPPRTVTAETEPFIRVEQVALQALSGRYLARSRRLLESLEPVTFSRYRGSGVVPPVTGARSIDDRTSQSGGTVVSQAVETDAASSTTDAAPSPLHPPEIWGNVPPQNPNFTGREELLDQLRERMRAGTTAVLPQALHGMGGVGKTQLAVEYVYRNQHAYDVIWWVPAERPPQAKTALAELAQRMGLSVSQHVNAAVPVVLDALRRGQPYGNWLLVFDNAESPEALRDCMPAGGPGTVLVTSRNPRWAAVAAPLEVDVFKRAESVQLLRRRRPDLTEEAAGRLAAELGDLPLAIEQAAAWLVETGMPVDEYLRLFQEKRADLLTVAAPVDYQLPVAAAWNVSLEQLVTRSPAALRLLQVCSFLASEPIPRTLLGSASNADVHPDLSNTLRDPMRLNRAIREINRYALARINYRDNSVHMHRLIQAVLIDQMSDEEQAELRHSAHLLLAANDRNDPVSPDNWGIYSELYPHLMAAEAYRSIDPRVQQLVANSARFLYWLGDHEAARDLAQRAYESWREQLGAEAPSTLSIGRYLGFTLYVNARYVEAQRFNQELLAAHQRVFSTDTEELLDAVGATAADERVAGRFQESLRICEDVHRRHVRAFGDEDPETLRAAHNLAISLRLVGDFQQALVIDRETRQRRSLLFGEDHPITLSSAQNLLIDRRELGEYVAVQAEQQATTDRLRRLHDVDHPQVLRAVNRLAVALRKAGRHQAARASSAEARSGLLNRYGPRHADTVSATLNYAIDLRACGELAESAAVHDEAVTVYAELVGEEHPHTVAASLNAAVVQRLRGDLSQARATNEGGLASLTAALGEEHPLTLGCALNLASDCFVQGDVQRAYELDTLSVERLVRALGEDHPTTLAARGNLAIDLAALGQSAEAESLLAATVAAFQRKLGGDHPATVVAADLTIRADCDLDPMPW